MTYNRYGLALVRLEQKDIEMLRSWRNEPKVVENMEFQTYISPEMQNEWFKRINNINNFFFLIKKEEQWIGMIHLSDINYEIKTTKSGILIGNPSYLNTSIPVFSSIALLNFAFYDLGLEEIFIKINKANKKALKYNQHLGFYPIQDKENVTFLHMKLTPDVYQIKTKRIQAMLLESANESASIEFDDRHPIDTQIKNQFFSQVTAIK